MTVEGSSHHGRMAVFVVRFTLVRAGFAQATDNLQVAEESRGIRRCAPVVLSRILVRAGLAQATDRGA